MAERQLIDREIFFGNPEIAQGKLSPDGQFIAFMKAYEGVMNLYVKRLDDDFADAVPLTNSKRPIMGFFWTIDSAYILYVNDNNGDENFNLFSVKPSVAHNTIPASTNLTPMQEVTVQIFHVSRRNPDELYIGVNDRDKAWHDLYKLTISTGKLDLIYKNENRFTGWDFDWDESPRLAYRTDENGFSEILSIKGFEDFQLIYKTNLQESAHVVGWNKDNSRAYLISNKGKVNLSTLFEMNPENGEVFKVEDDPEGRVDISGMRMHRHDREIIYTNYIDDKSRKYWKNEDWKDMYEKLEDHFSGKEIDIVSTTDDYSILLIGVNGDKNSPVVYSYDYKSGDIKLQYVVRPKLAAVEDKLSPMLPLTYKSSDGLDIPGYLTLPVSADEPKGLPTVVVVHGGPKGPRDYWGYNALVQFLADRGYAVLQPNFRASGGYGKSFLNAGDKQWGKLMQDDITYGVKYLIDSGVSDPDRIAIMGGSYGGYATLAGLAFTPNLYACGVDIVGPSNLFTLLESIPPYWEAGRKWLYEMTGDPNTEEGRDLLKNASPLFSADKIKRPLLIVQGATDPRVKQAESDQIVAELKSKGHDVAYLLAEDEGHGFRDPINKMAMYAEIEKFFSKHLGGLYQKDMPPHIAERLEKLLQD